MNIQNQWDFQPWRPYDSDPNQPVFARLAPSEKAVEGELLGFSHGQFKVEIVSAESGEKLEVEPNGHVFHTDNLQENCEYRITAEDAAGRSASALFRTGSVPGVVVNYLHPEDKRLAFSGQYLCSPSLIKLPDGRLLASMDIFHPKGAQNLTVVFSSDDGGTTWHYLTDLFPCFWGRLFLHRGILFMLGLSCEYGDLLIGRSDDGGCSWSAPSVLARGSNPNGRGFHRAPTAPAYHSGRLWFSVEYGSWVSKSFSSGVISIPENGDLMNPQSWTLSAPLLTNPNWPGASVPTSGSKPTPPIEGNLITAPDGALVNFLRCAPGRALALTVRTDNPAAAQEFRQYVDFPAAGSKFELKEKNGIYWAAGNPAPPRNVLAVYKSTDLINWQHAFDIVNKRESDGSLVGFQYPSFIFDENKMLLLSRTACNGANNFHDNNYVTFHEVLL